MAAAQDLPVRDDVRRVHLHARRKVHLLLGPLPAVQPRHHRHSALPATTHLVHLDPRVVLPQRRVSGRGEPGRRCPHDRREGGGGTGRCDDGEGAVKVRLAAAVRTLCPVLHG